MLTRQTAACQIGDAVYYAGDARHYSDRIPVLLAGYAAWAVLRDEEVVGWLTPSRTAEATNGQAGTVGCYLAAAGGKPGLAFLGQGLGVRGGAGKVGQAHYRRLAQATPRRPGSPQGQG